MSHKATNWAIEQRGLKPATKLVLWHLCDRHHPDNGCFPSQSTLAHDCEMSRSSVNDHLKVLEDSGLIRRIQRTDRKNRRRRSTFYLIRCDYPDGFPGDEGDADDASGGGGAGGSGGSDDGSGGVVPPAGPCPKSGHGMVAGTAQIPCPKSGHGAMSEKPPIPCPEKGEFHVRNSDTNPVREPLKNLRARGSPAELPDDLSRIAAFWVAQIRDGKVAGVSTIKAPVAREIRASGLLSDDEIRTSGLPG